MEVKAVIPVKITVFWDVALSLLEVGHVSDVMAAVSTLETSISTRLHRTIYQKTDIFILASARSRNLARVPVLER
jgi:hypothetical protein